MIFLILCASVFNLFAYHEVSTEMATGHIVSALKDIESLNKNPNPECAESFEAVTIKGCPNQNEVSNDITYAWELVSKLQTSINSYFSKSDVLENKKLLELLIKISKTNECISSKLKTVNVECTDKTLICRFKMAYSHTMPFFFTSKRDIYLCNYARTANPNLYWTPNIRSGTLIHEAAHLCGTNLIENYDHDFTLLLTSHQSKFPALNATSSKVLPFSDNNSAADHSENYMFWSFAGFCLPGFDCFALNSK